MLDTWIIAHRGASHDAPENTMAAIQLGWRQQADAVEIDVQFSKDGQVVVIHDDNTGRTTGVRRKIAALTLAAVIMFALLRPRSRTLDALLVGLGVSLLVNDTAADVIGLETGEQVVQSRRMGATP